MESERFYERLLPAVRCEGEERAWLEATLKRIAPTSLDRAAYQLLNVDLIAGPHPALSAQVKGVLVGELQANVFSRIRMRTAMTCLAWMGSHWAPSLGLRGSIQRLVEDTVIAHASSPIYQVFLRAVDYRWDELVRVGAGLGKFGADLALDLSTGDLTPQSAKLWIKGTDAAAFGVLVLPGFLRGIMRVLHVVGEVQVTDEEEDWLELSVRWEPLK